MICGQTETEKKRDMVFATQTTKPLSVAQVAFSNESQTEDKELKRGG